jgi:hypothetical protein
MESPITDVEAQADDGDLPRVVARHIRAVAADIDRVCALRLARELRNPKHSNRGAGARYSVGNRIESDARVAHTELRVATAVDFPTPTDLIPEQQAVYRVAASAYVALFAERPGRTVDGIGWSSDLDDPGATIVSPPGLALETPRGLEIRSLQLAPRPVDETDLRVLRVRLAAAGFEGCRYVQARLLDGTTDEVEIDSADVRVERTWLAEVVDRTLALAATERARVGEDCRDCQMVVHCPTLRTA